MNSKLTFSLAVNAFSVNKMTYRDVRFKSAEYKEWATRVLHLLSEEKGLVDLAAQFDDSKHAFAVSVIVEYPQHIFYNKAGAISSKTVDCTNVGKPLIDLIFGDTMEINDKYITHYSESKRPGALSRLVITIELISSTDF